MGSVLEEWFYNRKIQYADKLQQRVIEISE